MSRFITETVVHRGSSGVEPVRTESVRTEPARTEPAKTEPTRIEPIEPVVHRGSNGVESVAAPLAKPTRIEHTVARTSDLDPFEPGENEPSGPVTYEPAEPVTSFGNQEHRMMESARPVSKPAKPASYLNERPMSKSEPWRLEPARPAQHTSFHSVLGSERSQPIRSRAEELYLESI